MTDPIDFAAFTLESALHEVMQRREEMELARNKKATDFYATWEQAFRALQYGLAECAAMKRTYANILDRVTLLEKALASPLQTPVLAGACLALPVPPTIPSGTP